MSLTYSFMEWFLSLSLTFMAPLLLKIISQLFCRMPFNLGFSDISLWLDSCGTSSAGLLQKRYCVVLMVFQMATISICLNNNVHFDNVITVVSPGLLYCKGPPFSFSVDNCLNIPFLFKLSVYSLAYICIGS